MTTINRHTEHIATWLRRRELADLSDRALQDIGVSRRHVGTESCKPFWMA